jgi:hypothetical protein
MKVANGRARPLVQAKKEFKGNNTFSVEYPGRGVYAVYSYGFHWPLFANVKGQWFANADKYSVSTSKHRSQLYPLGENVIEVSKNVLVEIIDSGELPLAAAG